MSESNIIKAAVLRTIGKPLVIEELIIPKLSRGQVLVKYLYSGVCRSQLMEVNGGRGKDKWLPHMLGHEGVGIVQQIGPEVKTVQLGNTVVVGWLPTNGIDAKPAHYLNSKTGEKINSGKAVTFATHAVVSENRVFLKPKSMCDKTSVLLGCALPTGAGMVLNETQPGSEDRVLIIGLGGIGLSILVTLLLLGITNVSIIEPNIKKLKLAKSLGALGKLTTDPNDKSLKPSFDLCYEASGRTLLIEKGFDLIKNSGIILFASHPPTGDKIRLDPHELIKGKKIFGSWGGSSDPEKIASRLEKLKYRKYLHFLLGNEYSLSNINNALDDLSEGKSLRPIINLSYV